MEAYREVEVKLHSFLTSHCIAFSGQLYALAALPRERTKVSVE
jgi:hypothetical protein